MFTADARLSAFIADAESILNQICIQPAIVSCVFQKIGVYRDITLWYDIHDGVPSLGISYNESCAKTGKMHSNQFKQLTASDIPTALLIAAIATIPNLVDSIIHQKVKEKSQGLSCDSSVLKESMDLAVKKLSELSDLMPVPIEE